MIVKDQIKKAKSVAVDTDYSAQLDDNGKIKGIKAADYVSIPDYNNITADLSEIEYSDESVEKDIDTLLNNKKYLDSSADLIAANGDKIIRVLSTVLNLMAALLKVPILSSDLSPL